MNLLLRTCYINICRNESYSGLSRTLGIASFSISNLHPMRSSAVSFAMCNEFSKLKNVMQSYHGRTQKHLSISWRMTL